MGMWLQYDDIYIERVNIVRLDKQKKKSVCRASLSAHFYDSFSILCVRNFWIKRFSYLDLIYHSFGFNDVRHRSQRIHSHEHAHWQKHLSKHYPMKEVNVEDIFAAPRQRCELCSFIIMNAKSRDFSPKNFLFENRPRTYRIDYRKIIMIKLYGSFHYTQKLW